jgi:hypothetical protein
VSAWQIIVISLCWGLVIGGYMRKTKEPWFRSVTWGLFGVLCMLIGLLIAIHGLR